MKKKKKAATKAARKTASRKPAAAKNAATYTPKPVGGTGWAPFRYPPQ
jgi:hypothetical protein